MRTTMPLRYWPLEKNDNVAASPRSWSSALCRYARYSISGTGRKPDTAAPSASPRMDVSSSSVSNTRPAPKRAWSPRVMP